MNTLTNPKTGATFDSPFAYDSDARAALLARLAAGDFTRKPEFPRSIASKPTLTPAMRFWLHKLATKSGPPESAKTGIEVELAPIVKLLDKAGTHLKKPAIVLSVKPGLDIKIARAPVTGKWAGSIYVTSPVFRGPYYGRVTGDAFYSGRDCNDEVLNVLQAFADDPAGVAGALGRETGKCCFCRKTLSDARSTSVGYGPDCAEHFGLPWGSAVVSAI